MTYPQANAHYKLLAFRRAHEAEPSAAWAGVFWTSLAATLGRTAWGCYQFGRRHGFDAKVDPSLREYDPCACGRPASHKRFAQCGRCYAREIRSQGRTAADRQRNREASCTC